MAERMLTFKSGGWVLALSGVMGLISILYIIRQPRHIGDGRHAETYGFDLSRSVVPREQIVAGGFAKDVMTAMVEPPMMTMAQALTARESEHSTLLKPADRVIGISIAGDSRAYPQRALALREIEVINDTVAGIPVVITYNPLCDSAVVLRRTMDDKTLTFGVSGLLYNSCLLMYDRQSDPKLESLWSPLAFKAVAGPNAARMLAVIPCEVVTWADWKSRHPDSKVVQLPLPNAETLPDYTHYLSNDKLNFPVLPAWDKNILPNKTPIMALRVGKIWHVLVPDKIAQLPPDKQAEFLQSIPGVTLTFDPATKTLRAQGDNIEVAYCFIFAWYAQHPTETVLEP